MSLMGMVVAMVVVIVVIVAATGPMDLRFVSAQGVVRGMVVIVMIVIVVIMAMMIVAMIMPVDRRGGDIGAAFRIERRLDLQNAGAETAGHVFDDVIAADAQALLQQFGRQVTIAQMPGDARQRRRVGAANLQELFGRGDYFDNAPVFQRQAVAGAQHDRLRQIEQKGEAAHADHRDPPAVAIVIVEHDRVGRLARPRPGWANLMSVQHGFPEIP
jgi:hypothetical protein